MEEICSGVIGEEDRDRRVVIESITRSEVEDEYEATTNFATEINKLLSLRYLLFITSKIGPVFKTD
jgi:hypothetical protein